uniref:DDE Tnp4 domain-containing protein n=1 Tax=Labrus bergylta TaxID=56723 RepID=A0A3Q3G0A4_9LABR
MSNCVVFFHILNSSTFKFLATLCTLQAFLPQLRITKLAVHDQLLVVLMRLRLGLMFTDLGKRFGISRSKACEIFTHWRPVLAKFMREKVIVWLPRDTLKRIRPQSFNENYPKATCIIGCTEKFVQRPKNLRKRSQTYSNYKHHNTCKLLYCISPNGYVMFVSKLFGGRASDTFITKNSGLLDHLIPGDQILADRGFTIADALPPGVTLALPAFTRGCKELSQHGVTETRHLANVRIHVERAIRRLKGFTILSHEIVGSVKHVDDIINETEEKGSEIDEGEDADEQEQEA